MKRKNKRRATQVPTCVCGGSLTHPPILPGERKSTDKSCPPEVATKGHKAHAFSYQCSCGYCLSLG